MGGGGGEGGGVRGRTAWGRGGEGRGGGGRRECQGPLLPQLASKESACTYSWIRKIHKLAPASQPHPVPIPSLIAQLSTPPPAAVLSTHLKCVSASGAPVGLPLCPACLLLSFTTLSSVGCRPAVSLRWMELAIGPPAAAAGPAVDIARAACRASMQVTERNVALVCVAKSRIGRPAGWRPFTIGELQ